LADYHTSDCLWDRLIDWELSIWVNRDSFSSVIFPTVIDVRINKGNAAQSFMFKIQGWRSMGGIMENTSFWLLVAIMQPLLYFISLEYFGQIVAIAIPWSILILFLIWMWASGKNPFASDEEE
jgi:hypothetical protein